jgi:quercetin dioxygenase-like cupin family protein
LGSLFIGGFEASWLQKPDGRHLDLLAATQHDLQAQDDYGRCRALGIRAVRETARWPLIDRAGRFLLDEVQTLARLGREAGLTQIWGLMHYGYPDDLDPFSAALVDRFARYAAAVARVLHEEIEGPIYYAPVNEISFHSWAAGAGHLAPYAPDRALEWKRQLVRAALAATNAIWEIDPGAQIVTVDPMVRQHAPPSRPDLQSQVQRYNQEAVFHSFDLLAGRQEPELGGSRAHLGILGINYYTVNQWVITPAGGPARVLTPDDPAYTPLSELLIELQERYGGPLLIAETGAHAEARADWIAYVVDEAARALERGVEFWGICLYPVVTSPDWEDPTAFFDAGVFDVRCSSDGRQQRVLSRPVAEALRKAQRRLDPANLPIHPLPPSEPLAPPPPILVTRPLEKPRFRTETFSYQTLLAGDGLLVERYCFEPRARLHPHRHDRTEHVLTVMAGQATVDLGDEAVVLASGETLIVPAGVYHGIRNEAAEPLIVQQVSAPKPWDARFGGPHPSQTR